jgi:ribosome-associated protein
MEEVQEKSLHPTPATSPQSGQATSFAELDPAVRLAIESASEKKAFDIVVLDLREIASFTEFFVIASGANQRQIQAIADDINEKLKQQNQSRPIRVEGYNSAEWVLLDYGDFIVHIFDKDARELYDLTRLWRDAKRVTLPAEVTAPA